MAEFTWDPDYGARAPRKPRIRSHRFGDGYEQRYQDGLNAKPQVWSLSFTNREVTEIDDIEDFLDESGAVTPFEWTPPRSSTSGMYICREWERGVDHGNLDSLTAVFEQVFDLAPLGEVGSSITWPDGTLAKWPNGAQIKTPT